MSQITLTTMVSIEFGSIEAENLCQDLEILLRLWDVNENPGVERNFLSAAVRDLVKNLHDNKFGNNIQICNDAACPGYFDRRLCGCLTD